MKERHLEHAQRTLIKQLDMEEEMEYLKRDVLTLPVVTKEMEVFKDQCFALLGMERKKALDKDHSITLPAFGKYLFEEFTKQYTTENLRTGISAVEYDLMR